MYYVYAWLREDRQSPFYLGKGTGRRAWRSQSPGGDRVQLIKVNLTQQEALDLEKTLIKFYGRQIDGGILENVTNGPGGVDKPYFSPEALQKCREAGKRGGKMGGRPRKKPINNNFIMISQ